MTVNHKTDQVQFVPAGHLYLPDGGLPAIHAQDFCPIKDQASYLDLGEIENAIWCYAEPMHGVARIRGHYAFDLNKGFEVREKLAALPDCAAGSITGIRGENGTALNRVAMVYVFGRSGFHVLIVYKVPIFSDIIEFPVTPR